jgi:hypothetical protein
MYLKAEEMNLRWALFGKSWGIVKPAVNLKGLRVAAEINSEKPESMARWKKLQPSHQEKHDQDQQN